MGRFVNPDNSAFQVALNSEIYVDKTGLLEYTNHVLGYAGRIYLQQPSTQVWKIICGKYACCLLQQRV